MLWTPPKRPPEKHVKLRIWFGVLLACPGLLALGVLYFGAYVLHLSGAETSFRLSEYVLVAIVGFMMASPLGVKIAPGWWGPALIPFALASWSILLWVFWQGITTPMG